MDGSSSLIIGQNVFRVFVLYRGIGGQRLLRSNLETEGSRDVGRQVTSGG